MSSRKAQRLAIVSLLVLLAAATAAAQNREEWRAKNLHYFPEDIARNELIAHMRQFSFALGVACTHCHGTAEQTGFDLEGVDFSLDIKPAKSKAREMLRMTEAINAKLLAPIADSPLDLEVGCFTCHSGLALPERIEDRVLRIAKADGVEAAVADYREIRERYYGSAAYDFREQPLVEAAATLHREGDFAGAIALCDLNLDFHPSSGQSKFRLAEARFENGDLEIARTLYEEMLEARPGNRRAKERLEAIEERLSGD